MNNIALFPQCIVIGYIVLFGLCIGSFLNVAILRGLTGEDMVFKRSKCPKCENTLKWYMNIPLLSYIFLRGKCAYCKCKISFQYPLVEFITALMYVCAYLAFGPTLKFIFICIFLSIFIVMSATDFKETVIIDYHAYMLLVLGLIYSFLKLGDISILSAIIGALVGFLFFEIISRIAKKIIGCRIFGEGDSLIALGLGAIFGYKSLLIIIALSFLFQSACAIPILAFHSFKANNKKLAISYLLTFFAIVASIASNAYELINYPIYYYPLLIIIVVTSLWSLKNIIQEIKQKKEMLEDNENKTIDEDEAEKTFHLMPFGPALLISATICLFYISQIKSVILNFIS